MTMNSAKTAGQRDFERVSEYQEQHQSDRTVCNLAKTLPQDGADARGIDPRVDIQPVANRHPRHNAEAEQQRFRIRVEKEVVLKGKRLSERVRDLESGGGENGVR